MKYSDSEASVFGMHRNPPTRGGLLANRLSWILALAIAVAGGALMGLIGDDASATRSPVPLPPSAESARAADLRSEFPGSDRIPVVLVVTRNDGEALSPSDLAAAEQARDRMLTVADPDSAQPAPVVPSQDGKAVLAPVPVQSDLTGFALSDKIKELRAAARDGLPKGLTVNVTGGPAFGADIASAFSGANVTLLAVTGAVVALLLIVTYRSPVLWLVPLLVIAVADRVAAVLGGAIAQATGMSADGSTAGITSVLVFGAGTNYALLLISRYREELRRFTNHRTALQTAVRHAGPAILASNATVVLALLTLLFASSPSTRSLGVQAASGLVVAAIFVLLALPPLLALFGPQLFWPFIPQPDAGEKIGAWYRIADRVSGRAGLVATTSIVALAVLATGLFATPIGLSQIDQFRVQADSVTGHKALAEHFPSGMTDPTVVIGHTAKTDEIAQAIGATRGVVSTIPAGESTTGLTQWRVITDATPGSQGAFDTVARLRDSVHMADPGTLVGGSDAQALDAKEAAVHDREVIIPAILIVVLVVLYLLLRAALAPLVLVAATVVSAMAALGLGGWVSVHLLGFPALDIATPLLAFLFLVALGVDYTIFLVTRAREETPQYGTRLGIVRAVSTTGAVITSAGIVLAAVFCVLGVLPLIVLTQLGIIVGLGILLDTFVVRTVVIPALFTLIGPRIWWPAFQNEPAAEY